MLPALDLKTITFISGVYFLIFGVGLILVARKSPHHRGLYTAAAADLFMSGSMIAIYLRGIISTEISIQLTNALIHIAIIVSHRAITLFRGDRAQNIFYAAYFLLAAQLLFTIYYTYHQPNLQMRIVIISLAICTQFLFMAYSLYSFKIHSLSSSQRLLNYSTILLAAIFLFRAFGTLLGAPSNSLQAITVLQSVPIAGLLVFVILKDYSMFIGIIEKSMKDLIRTSRTDTLTKLYNRRGLTEIAERELNKLLRHIQPLTLVLCDLDDFKKINDNHGHTMGDNALRVFAKILKSNTRDVDICARFGGDEFIMIFPCTPIEKTAIIINKIKKKLASTYIDNDKKVVLSASFGVANYKDGSTLESLINTADKALYESKQHKPGAGNVTKITPLSTTRSNN